MKRILLKLESLMFIVFILIFLPIIICSDSLTAYIYEYMERLEQAIDKEIKN